MESKFVLKSAGKAMMRRYKTLRLLTTGNGTAAEGDTDKEKICLMETSFI
jgi:hypothetical protein